jgi:hypothetical protein
VGGFTIYDVQAAERNRSRRELPDPAKEVRAMGLAGFLRRRHDRLYDERIAELAGVTRRQTRWALLAGLASCS